jgi:hypothetical protein
MCARVGVYIVCVCVCVRVCIWRVCVCCLFVLVQFVVSIFSVARVSHTDCHSAPTDPKKVGLITIWSQRFVDAGLEEMEAIAQEYAQILKATEGTCTKQHEMQRENNTSLTHRSLFHSFTHSRVLSLSLSLSQSVNHPHPRTYSPQFIHSLTYCTVLLT